MPDPRAFHLTLPRYTGPRLPEPPHAWYPGVKAHWTASTSERAARGDGTVRAFVIHATAGASSAGAMTVMQEHRASWHWLVPDENEAEHGRHVWACAPESRAAWHVRNDCTHPDVQAGARFVNYWSLGVEAVNTQANDPFSDWQVAQVAALVRYAWSRYPCLVDVVSHAKLDPARRRDPGDNFPWERLCDLVLGGAPAPAADCEPVEPAVTNEPAVRVVGPGGELLDLDARMLDGVTMIEARPLIEALGFGVAYEEGVPRTMRIVRPADGPGPAR